MLKKLEKGKVICYNMDRLNVKGDTVMENVIICNCKQVSYKDIEHALENHNKMEDVLQLFEEVQRITHCSTGCGGCHDKVLDVISEIMMA